MDFEKQIRIEASPAKLWPLLTDPESVMRWNPSIETNEAMEGPESGLGARTRVQIREGGRLVPYESEVTAWEPEQYLEIRLTGKPLGASPMDVGYRLDPEADGVSLTYTSRWTPIGIMLKLMTPLLKFLGRRHADDALGKLKEIAEGPD